MTLKVCMQHQVLPLGIGERKFIQLVEVTWQRWPPCPYMVKTIKDIFLWNRKADDLETWYTALSTRVLPSMFKWCPWVTLTYFTARSNLVPYAFVWEKVKTMDFSETIVVYDIKFGRCSQLNESFMSTKGQGQSLTLFQIIRTQYF